MECSDSSESEDEPYFKNYCLERENEEEERKWREKLAAEFEYENAPRWSGCGWEEPAEYEGGETYDEWTNRIYNEYQRKTSSSRTQSSHAKPDGTSINTAENRRESYFNKLRKERERMKRRYNEFQKQGREIRSKRRKQSYDIRYRELLDKDFSKGQKLRLVDLPWGAGDDVTACIDSMLEGVNRNDTRTFRKCLKDLIRNWHPDKFQQKFGNFLDDETSEEIMRRVNSVSQGLNALYEGIGNSCGKL